VFQSFRVVPVDDGLRETSREALKPSASQATRSARGVEERDPAGGPLGIRGGVSARALRRHEAARRDGARALAQPRRCCSWTSPSARWTRLTAESLRAEVLDIWEAKDKNPTAIVWSATTSRKWRYMADRIVVPARDPGACAPSSRTSYRGPRSYRSTEFLQLVDKLHDIITGNEMPDVPATRESRVCGGAAPRRAGRRHRRPARRTWPRAAGGRRSSASRPTHNRENGQVIAAANARSSWVRRYPQAHGRARAAGRQAREARPAGAQGDLAPAANDARALQEGGSSPPQQDGPRSIRTACSRRSS
jgi:hypothetical protein